MKLFQEISITRFIAKVIFVLLPTIAVVAFILWNTGNYFAIMRSQWMSQTVYFSAGLMISFFLYQFRFRFLPLFLGLILICFSIYKGLDNFTTGEFDAFFVLIQFLTFSYLFCAGWLVGWGLQRVRFFPIIISSVLLLLSIFLISKTGEITITKLLQYLVPIGLYIIYMVFVNEDLHATQRTDSTFWWRFSKRLILFSLLMSIVFSGVIFFMYDEINEKVAEYGGHAKEGENQLLQNEKDQTVKNRESMGLGGANNRNKNPEPILCAHIDNYIEGTDIPNPLYLTAYHFTKFDTSTETFERDTLNSFNDEFLPNPSDIPLFFTYKDSSKIFNELKLKRKKTVEIEVYKKRLSYDAFVAPSTSFFIQPITVEKDFQNEFTSAYRSKSYVSDLNSAYFIYNTDDPDITAFQQLRFDILRKAKGYQDLDSKFLKYYTFFPSGPKYHEIKLLADSISQGVKTTIDKVLAIKNYFLAKDELGEQIYKYSDNPGIPGLPGASNLMYFLFESKKGYCAYYAASTVFLLRAMNIPSRIVTGFLTVDRSDKNKGWYWYYEDQSHAWVQVYFPEYGWIDFDTTVGNDEAEQSPTPDGTPPMQPPKAVLAANGIVVDLDTLKKLSTIKIDHLIFKDVEYKNFNQEMAFDLKVANIWKDSLKIPLSAMKKNDTVMLVSYAEKLKQFAPEKTIEPLLNKLSFPIPTDEVYIKLLKEKSKQSQATQAQNIPHPITYYIKRFFVVLLILVGILFLIPTIIYNWYKLKMKYGKHELTKLYSTYKASIMLLNQLKIEQGNMTPLYFARNFVDPQFETSFTTFMTLYLKSKYANQQLSKEENLFVEQFFIPFEKKVKQSFKFSTRVLRFLNINQFISYFQFSEPKQNA